MSKKDDRIQALLNEFQEKQNKFQEEQIKFSEEQRRINKKLDKQNKNNKRIILIMIAFSLILSGITGAASYTLAAGDTSFTPHDTTWNVENVEAALNNLNLRENQLDTHYSTEEQIVGEWIDGKPIYQKTYLIQKTDNSTEFLLSHGLTNVTITNISGIIQMTTGTTIPLVYNWVENNGNTQQSGTCVWVTATQIGFRRRLDEVTSNANIYITLQYTKTTN